MGGPAPARSVTGQLPRPLHPGAWWLWAVAVAVAAARTTNPLVLILLLAAVCTVVLSRRGDAPWAQGFRLYLWLAAFILVLRVGFRVVFGGGEGGVVLLDLPEIPLPDWVAGIHLLGPVSTESLLGGLYDGLRLATMVVCVGAANALADPRRLLKAVPGALTEIGTAVVVALSVFPQLAESVIRVRRARRLRPRIQRRGIGALRAIIVPVLEDALDRSLLLAASMDSRGYGRSAQVEQGQRRAAGVLTITGLSGICAGTYGVLDGYAPPLIGLPMLVCGVALAAVGFGLTGRRVRRTRYRPDRWRTAEILALAAGVAAAVVTLVTASADPSAANPTVSPPRWPEVPVGYFVAAALAVLPAVLTPPAPLLADGVDLATQPELSR